MPQLFARLICCLLAAILALSTGCASTQVSLIVSRDVKTEKLNVVYRFSRPVDVLSFETEGGPIRRYWTPLTEGVEIRGDTAVSTRRRVDEMRFAIRPDELQFDRVNPGMYVLGGGAVFNISYLLPDSARFVHELQVAAPGEALVTDHVRTRLDARPELVTDRRGFAYLGPSRAVRQEGRVVVVAPAAVDAPILDVVSSLFSSAASFYAEFADPPLHAPRIYLAVDDTDKLGQAYRRGTVLGNALAVYLAGSDWLNADLDSGRQHKRFAKFIRHETFHLFQGGHHSPSDDGHRSAWLWEGSAEYFAARLGAVQDGEAQPAVQELGTECLKALLDEPLVRDGVGHIGKAPYACGHFLIAATALLSEDRDRAVAEIWKEMLDPDGVHGSMWTTDEFFDVARAQGTEAALDEVATLVIDTPGVERWDGIAAKLRKFVPDIDIPISDVVAAAEALDLVSRLITSHCRGASGFWNHEDSITLDASDCTDGLIDRAEVTGVESRPFGEPTAWLDTFKARCAAGEVIRFQLRDGSQMVVPCSPRRIQNP